MVACGTDGEPASTSTTAAAAGDTRVEPVARPAGPGDDGDVLDAAEIQPPSGARSWRVDYRTTAIDGNPAGARMTLTVPMTPPPDGGFGLVVYAHPTKGTADACAPSLEGPTAIPLISEFLRAGWAVAAPDYEGLAAEGPHPYLVGRSEARNLLDATRAAAEVKGAGITPGGPAVLWGFSQGGHAALFAAQLAPELAPELDLRGVAVAAPVSDPAAFVRRSEDWPAQFGILATVVGAYAEAYPELDPATVLTPEAVDDLSLLEQRCIADINAAFDRPIAEQLVRSPRDEPAYAARLAENLTATGPIAMPALVVQGGADQIIDPADTAALVDRLCGLGVATSSLVRAGEDHAVRADDVLIPWIQGRMAGGEPVDTCP